MDATIQVPDSRRRPRESSRREDKAICKILGRKGINGGEELEEVWPIVEAILLQVTSFCGGN